MVVDFLGFIVGPGYEEERLSSDELENKAAEAPDVEGFVDGFCEN